jgi:hypothetical protein
MQSIQEDMREFQKQLGEGSIQRAYRLECDLAQDLDLSEPDALTSRIETATAVFVDDIKGFLTARSRT